MSDPTRPGRTVPLALIAICLGYFLVILDSTVVNVALPAIRADLATGATGPQWVVDGYLLTFAAGLLGAGALGDRYGARRVFQLGLAVFVLASAACGAAPSVSVLVAARAVQGVGAALAVPTSLALLRAGYPSPRARARAVGVWGAVAGLAAAGGPILGGALVELASWRLVFTVNVPLGLLAMLVTARRVPAGTRPDPGRPVNVVGQLIGVIALGGLSYALIEGGHRGLTPDVLAAAVLCLLGCLPAALSAARPLGRLGRTGPVVPGLARRSGFAVGTAVGFLLNLGFYGELYVLNLYFQQSWHCPPLLAGLALLPQMGVVALGSALSGRHTARVGGPRRTMLIGLMVGGLGLLGLAPGLTGWPYPLLLVPLMAAGFGMSFTMPAVTTAVVDAAPAEQAGQAAGVINTARQVGSLVGVALLGALAAGPIGGPVHGLSRPPDQSVSGPLNGSENGPAAAMLAAAASFLLAWALVWLAPGNRRHSGTPVCRHGTRRADHDRN